MNIEQLIQDNTAALLANTAALREVIALSGAAPAKATPEVATPAPVEVPVAEAPAEKPKKAKAVKVAATPVESTPEVVETPAAAKEDTSSWDRDTYLLNITETVKRAFTVAADLTAKKNEYSEIRTKFGVAKASELGDDQLNPFYTAVSKL